MKRCRPDLQGNFEFGEDAYDMITRNREEPLFYVKFNTSGDLGSGWCDYR